MNQVSTMPAPKSFKACACGRCFTKKEWDELPCIGFLDFEEDEDGPAERNEYRNCPCGSTLAISLEPLKKESSCSLSS